MQYRCSKGGRTMREMKKATCRYCGLQTDMHVLKKRKISDEKNNIGL